MRDVHMQAVKTCLFEKVSWKIKELSQLVSMQCSSDNNNNNM